MSADILQRGLDSLSINLTPEQIEKLLAYVDLLARWNRSYNLTAVRDPEEMLTRHLLDSLAIVPFLDDGPLIDVGTGGGLPGIPVAIARPQLATTLLDSNGKKTRFLVQAKASLGLDNVSVVHERVEDYVPPGPHSMVVSRAFASLNDMIDGCSQLLKPGGRFLAMKGKHPEAELDDVNAKYPERFAIELEPLLVPGLDEERCLVILHQQAGT